MFLDRSHPAARFIEVLVDAVLHLPDAPQPCEQDLALHRGILPPRREVRIILLQQAADGSRSPLPFRRHGERLHLKQAHAGQEARIHRELLREPDLLPRPCLALTDFHTDLEALPEKGQAAHRLRLLHLF